MTLENIKVEVLRLVQEHGLDRVSERIEHLIKPTIHISKAEAGDLPVGSSRFGGLPDVPPGFTWPCWRDRPLGFLAQLRCEELAAVDSSHLLPNSGVLYLFYDFIKKPWGANPKDRGGAVVLYVENAALASPASLPEGAKAEEVSLPQFSVRFSAVPSVPSPGCDVSEQLDLKQLGLNDEELDRYFVFFEAVCKSFTASEPCHQILGHSNNIQDDMQLECQLVSHGLNCEDGSGYISPRRAELEQGAADWRLLLQFDSDADLHAEWEDGGMIYFWIRESDLKAKKFSETWTILQTG
jgi:uncharacterized protein YwqG